MNNIKKSAKFLFLLILFSTFIMTSVFAAYNKNVGVYIDGKEVSDKATSSTNVGFIDRDRSFLPLRLVGEELKCKVDYIHKSRDIIISNNDTKIEMNVRSKDFKVNGKMKSMDVSPILYEDTTYIPLRYIGESFGKEISWDNDTKTCFVGKKPESFDEKKAAYQVYTFGNPKVTVKVPKYLMKDLVVEENKASDLYKGGLTFYDARGYDGVDYSLAGFLFDIGQALIAKEDVVLDQFGEDLGYIIDNQGYIVTYAMGLRFQDDYYEKIERPKIETPHYKNLLNKLKKEVIVDVEQKDPKIIEGNYRVYTFGNPKVTVKVPLKLMNKLIVVDHKNETFKGVSIYNSDFTQLMNVKQVETNNYRAGSSKGPIIDERGNTFTNQWENYDSYIQEDPLYKEVIKTVKVEVAK